jgi:hypothetical protein
VSRFRYIAIDAKGYISSSYQGAESLYDEPGKARRYIGEGGKVLVVDVATLPAYVFPEKPTKKKAAQ